PMPGLDVVEFCVAVTRRDVGVVDADNAIWREIPTSWRDILRRGQQRREWADALVAGHVGESRPVVVGLVEVLALADDVVPVGLGLGALGGRVDEVVLLLDVEAQAVRTLVAD